MQKQIIKKYLSLIIFVFVIFLANTKNVFGAVFIIDNGEIEIGATWNGVDGDLYATVDFPEAIGFGTLQAFYNNGNGPAGFGPGDEVYLRNGTYSEDYGSIPYTSMPLPWLIDGTGWNDDQRILFSSYPGEWAVIDGNENDRCVIGYYAQGHAQGNLDASMPTYWIIERLEITNPLSSASSACGLGINGDSFKVRYCYIHDNIATSEGENPGGIRGYHFRNSVIEYNYFKNNGLLTGATISNSGDVVVFSDYITSRGNFTENSRNNNIYRYNLFEGSKAGVKSKGPQLIQASSLLDMTNQNKGEQIYRNIFKNAYTGVESDTDFTQVWGNIFDGCNIQNTWNREGYYNIETQMNTRRVCIYNNTVIGAPISFGVGYGEHSLDMQPYWTSLNNIVDGYGSNSGYGASMQIATVQCKYCSDHSTYHCGITQEEASGRFNWTGSEFNNNLIHNSLSNTPWSLPASTNCCNATGWITTSAFNSAYSFNNYDNSAEDLFIGSNGSDAYKINSEFIVSDGVTIANGGRGGSHPYLDGVQIPSYIGAVNPNDDAWVEGVLSLADVNNLRDASSDDPSWIEGSSISPDTTPPANPEGLSVN